ncbi:Uncharacterised protein [Mycobacteroides abscessus subsp. abscessus]|nr:Uncharacterised protein [Mycobacteroides abscessus subsp. abscessus]
MQRNLFGHGIGGHDGVRGVGSTAQSPGQFVHDLLYPGQHLVHRQSITDQAGGAHRDLNGTGLRSPVAQRLGDLFGGGMAVLESLRSGAGVGPTRVENHGTQAARREYLL